MMNFSIHDPHFLPHCGCQMDLALSLGNGLILVGENGIGKSTLLKKISTLISSRVLIEQTSTEYFFDRKLKVVKDIFLNENLPHFNRDNFLKLWKDFGLELKEERLLSQLSGGEAQSLKLTLGLCKDTDVYLLDEPSQFLDTHRKQTLISFLSELNAKKKSVLIVEHNLEWLPKDYLVQKLVIENDTLVLGDRWTIS